MLLCDRDCKAARLTQAMPCVSVVIPTFNHQNYVLATIESVLSQTFKDHQIIVVDDGSTDETANVLAPLIQTQTIVYYRQPNAGQAAARNQGLSAATGEFIAFLDDDDLWPVEKLSWQVDALRSNASAVAVGGSVEIIDRDARSVCAIPMARSTLSFISLFEGSPFWSPGQTLIRTSALASVGNLDVTVPSADDLDLWFKLARAGELLTDDRLALKYRLHPGNASRDLQRMHSNCTRVFNRHLDSITTSQRRHLQCTANRFLYDYIGRKSLRRCLADLRSMNLPRLAASLRVWGRFFPSAIGDRYVRSAMVKDLLSISRRQDPLGALLDN
jgi:glycosyltransferase involved in cell wall biosynthesis